VAILLFLLGVKPLANGLRINNLKRDKGKIIISVQSHQMVSWQSVWWICVWWCECSSQSNVGNWS